MNLNATVTVSEELRKTFSQFGSIDFVSAAAEAAYRFLIDYHRAFAEQWRGQHWLPSSKSGDFAEKVVKGWQPPVIAGDTAEIVNTFGLLNWKTTGGTIRPKQATMLTIPLTTAARAVGARDFPGELFRKGNTLALSLGTGAVSQPQYALVKSVTQKPWPDAMPPQSELNRVATQAIIAELERSF